MATKTFIRTGTGGYKANSAAIPSDIDLAAEISTATVIPGPYADDAAAATAGVAVGKPYYKSTGVVSVRLT